MTTRACDQIRIRWTRHQPPACRDYRHCTRWGAWCCSSSRKDRLVGWRRRWWTRPLTGRCGAAAAVDAACSHSATDQGICHASVLCHLCVRIVIQVGLDL